MSEGSRKLLAQNCRCFIVPNTKKATRIDKLSVRFERGEISFPKLGNGEFLRELLSYPNTDRARMMTPNTERRRMITPDLVKQFWHDALLHFGAKTYNKDDSEFMEIVGWFLDKVDVMNKESFLRRYTTTILDTIYRPFEIGVENSYYSLFDQISVLVHELVHVRQYQRNPAIFPVKYITNRADRADYEAQALAADLEIFYWVNGQLPDICSVAENLFEYDLKREHVEYVILYLESIGETISEGASVNDVAAWAMDWLEAHGVKGAANV